MCVLDSSENSSEASVIDQDDYVDVTETIEESHEEGANSDVFSHNNCTNITSEETITSPLYDGNKGKYTNNLNICWYIEAPFGKVRNNLMWVSQE